MQFSRYRKSGSVLLLLTMTGCAMMPPPAAPAVAPPTSAAVGGNNYIVAIAPPAVAKGTIWDFLGVKTLCAEIGMVVSCGLDLLGSQFPGLASALPMSNLSNPANLKSSNPAVAAAAGAKADENAAPQKVAALRYLGTLGCGGCYPDIEKALLAGLDDCTEVVRFEAAAALGETSRNQCRYCTSNRCCSPNVRKKLIKIATDTHDNGCYVEPSGRVRRMARVALCNCSGDSFDAEPQPIPDEGPSSEIPVPPNPDPAVAVNARESGQPQSDVEPANFAGKKATTEQAVETVRPTDPGSSSTASVKSRESAVKYDDSNKPADIIVKTSAPGAKPAAQPVRVMPPKPEKIAVRRDQGGPRIRWERAAVSIYRFETRDDAVAAMEFIRQKTLGENPEGPADTNLRYVTTREVGWTRPQDIRSPELARILFELPAGHVSPVIEVGDTLLVCRVLEREPADEIPDKGNSTGTGRAVIRDQSE